MSVLRIARAAYEANSVLCAALGEQRRPSWADISEEHQSIIFCGVVWAATNPDATPEQAHENSVKEWTLRGWKYGPRKNQEAKETPALIPWKQLPPGERLKNDLFLIVVRAMMDQGRE